MAKLIDSTIRLREQFKARTLDNGRLVGSAMGFLLSEDGAPLLVRLQVEGAISSELDGLPDNSRIAIVEGELFNSSWQDAQTKETRYMPVVRAVRLHIKSTAMESLNGNGNGGGHG